MSEVSVLSNPRGVWSVRLLKAAAILAFVVAALNVYSAVRLVGKPFAGFLPGANLLYMNLDKGFEIYDTVVAADGRPMKTNAQYERYIATVPPNSTISLTIEHDGKREIAVKTVRPYSIVDLVAEFGPSLVVGVLYLVVGATAFWLKPDNPAARAHLFLTLSSGLANTVWVEWFSGFWPLNAVQPYNESLMFLSSAALIHLALVFPFRRPVADHLPALVPSLYGVAAACSSLAVYAWADNLAAGRNFDGGIQSIFGVLMSVAMLASYVFGYGLLLHAVFRAPTLLGRRQARVALLGAVVATLPGMGLTVFAYILGYRVPYSPWSFALQMVAPVAFPLAIAYAIVRHKLFDIDLVIKRTVVYGMVVSALLAGYLLVAAVVSGGIHAIAGPAIASPAGGVLATAAVAVGFAPLRDRVRTWVDARFFRAAYQFDRVVADLGEALRTGKEAKALLAPFLAAIGKALQPEYLAALFLPDGAQEFVLVESLGRGAPDGLVVPLDHPAVRQVLASRAAVAEEPADFGSLHQALFLPLYVSGRVAGCVLAGPRKSGLAYDAQDRLLLATLAQQFEKKLEQDELERSDAQAERARTALSRYVSQQVADTVLQEHFAFGDGKRQDVTLMFTDIRGFTRMSENMPPEEVVSLLNAYFTRMVRATFEFDGMLDKYIGDGMMVVFGAPVPRADHAWRAVQAALRMREELAEFNAERAAAGLPALKIGIGLHSGPCVVGNIGSELRLDFTAIGDTVNTASRVESLTKDHGADILISSTTYEHVKDRVVTRPIPGVAIRGREQALDLFALEAARLVASEKPSPPGPPNPAAIDPVA